MGGAKGRWRCAPLLLAALLAAGCLGRWFGDSSEASAPADGYTPPCSSSRPRAFDEATTLGYSAADMLARLGGEHPATVTAVESGFWQTLGVDSPPTSPFELIVSIEYESGNITENECDYYLSIPVVVTLQVGDTLLQRSGVAMLEGSRTSATLEVQLPPPSEGDASPQTLTLGAVVYPTQISGELIAGQLGAPEAAFTGQRP